MIGKIGTIIIIESLFDGEHKTGSELYNDYIKRQIDFNSNKAHLNHQFITVNSKNDFNDFLQYILVNSEYMNHGILIHLEMHGSGNRNGLILNNSELLDWKYLNDKFREINIKINDKLFITMATCFGRFIFNDIDINQKSPYSGYISSSQEVYPHEIINVFKELFTSLIDKENIIDAYLTTDINNNKFYYKDRKRAFSEAYKNFLNQLENKEYLEKLRLDIRNDLKEKSAYEYSDEEIDLFLEKVIIDITEIAYKSFDFDPDN